MCEAVRFYEHWVNGTDLRAAGLATGRLPDRAPRATELSDWNAPSEMPVLALEPHEAPPDLPRIDSGALSPIAHVLLHGSMATRDACAFSDVDIAVIVDDLHEYPLEAHRAAVRELRKLLGAVFDIDPLMHHGLMFFSAAALREYDERFLPVRTLQCARVLHGPRELRLRLRPAPPGNFAQSLRACASSLRARIRRRDFLNDDYRLKSVLSGALLMPARVLAASGEHVYKRDSFELARESFSAREWEFIARCEALRAFWKRPPAPPLHGRIPSKTHPRIRQIIAERMAPRLNASRLSPSMIDGLIAGAHTFLDRVEAIA